MAELHIRKMTQEELGLALSWAAMEGWNPGLHDAKTYFLADPNGFLLAEFDGEPIGCISAIKYSPDFAFIGFYLVKPEFRGQGYGMQLWQAAMSYLSGCNIGLDGVAAQQANYQKSGFQLAYANVRFQGEVSLVNADKPNKLKGAAVPLGTVPLSSLFTYENAFFPADRTAFVQAWVEQDDADALAYVDEGSVQGYGVIRQCQTGYKIAPLFADSAEIARSLIATLTTDLPKGAAFFLDVPACHQDAVLLAKDFAMEPVFETARMYTQTQPALPLNRIYGVTSFEIG
ncbi:GCN5 family acetyltransferase [Marinomonas sp. SBI22]|uniref:GNAT family N-acetyltransferase n=1 Tax=unclassified Marinomonas TaxID=196814 RepID=UPI0007BBB690|nr:MULTISPECIES: GNAT family N-acetyltransferase [unclassified Marinomonas]KZM39316.1 GCN5 family acetyltransferase [Marinomonas sp. SBI22]KZM40137.1 GCN5 family acetyltransferase [Marinomonas sp. SBI8L]